MRVLLHRARSKVRAALERPTALCSHVSARIGAVGNAPPPGGRSGTRAPNGPVSAVPLHTLAVVSFVPPAGSLRRPAAALAARASETGTKGTRPRSCHFGCHPPGKTRESRASRSLHLPHMQGFSGMRLGGFEPPTRGLEGRRSSTELQAHDVQSTAEPCGIGTADARVPSFG